MRAWNWNHAREVKAAVANKPTEKSETTDDLRNREREIDLQRPVITWPQTFALAERTERGRPAGRQVQSLAFVIRDKLGLTREEFVVLEKDVTGPRKLLSCQS